MLKTLWNTLLMRRRLYHYMVDTLTNGKEVSWTHESLVDMSDMSLNMVALEVFGFAALHDQNFEVTKITLISEEWI